MNRISPRAARLAATAGVAAAAALFPTPSEAAFTTAKCAGDSIQAQGASFAKPAHDNAFIPAFGIHCADAGVTPGVSYNGSGSGAGRRAFGARSGANADGSQSRTAADRFVGSDEPMSATDQADINRGSDAVGDEGLVHTLPIAVGGVAIVVNLPDGCVIDKAANGGALSATQQGQLSDPTTPNRTRLQLTRVQYEQLMAGGTDLDTWGELVAWINDGNGTAGEPADAACATTPIVRVVRADSSGTTFALKEYLHRVNPGRGWITTYADNLTWPEQATVVKGTASGNGPLVDKVSATDGSVGYSDLATARSRQGNAFERQATPGDDKYWVKLQSKDGTTFVDPASAADGFVTGGPRGSSCATALLSGLPGGSAPTLGDWSNASANDSTPKGYGICTPTYALAWDDYAAPYKLLPGFNAAAEERKARTAVDYLESVLTVGQNNLASYDYAPLSPSVKDFTLAAVRSIGFNKAGDVDSGGGNNAGTPPPPVVQPPATQAPIAQQPPAPVAPSNAFTFPKPRNSKGRATFTVQVPGAGAVVVNGTAKIGKKKNQKVGSVAYQAKAGGAVKVSFKPNSKATKELKKKKKLKVTLTITFTPAGGTPKSSTTTVVLKPAPAKKKSTKKK